MKFRKEVIPFIIASLIAGLITAAICLMSGILWPKSLSAGIIIATVFSGYFLYFFRDPERFPPTDLSLILAAADGVVAQIINIREDKFLKTDTTRVSIFLSLFNVHVNRAPISGKSLFLGYFPGKHYFTFKDKSSDFNQHNSILIESLKTRCLVNQIVGPVCRRVVYWPDHNKSVDLKMGDRIGMMKFGSRLDMYFPAKDIIMTAKEGDTAIAGETVIGRLR